MKVMQWRIKRIVFITVLAFVTYVCVRPCRYEFVIEDELPLVHPNAVWEYMADFSHMKKLNPTLIDFTVLSERGNYNNWEYDIRYNERLSHWPYLHNVAEAHYGVHGNAQTHHYYVNSTHVTCFLFGTFCLNTDSEFKFVEANSSKTGFTVNTHCIETVLYECPPLLKYLCGREVVYQRTAVMRNLKNHFVERSRNHYT